VIGRSKNIGQKAAEEIIQLQDLLRGYRKTVHDLEDTLATGSSDDVDDILELSSGLADARQKVAHFTEVIQSKKKILGVDGRLNLQRLTTSPYIRQRVNALALKKRIRDRLRQRKFELERLERAYRQASNGKQLLHIVLPSVLIIVSIREQTPEPDTVSIEPKRAKHSSACQDL
jgi:hypothetical protein